MPTVLQWIQDDMWSEDEVEEITISGVEGDESRREVGCQWKSPREEEEQRKEVGCQSNAAERRDAAVQVDLLTQQLSGVAWKCVSVREDGPGGGTLLHHCCARLAAAENKQLQQTAPLPSMPLCEPLLLPLADASAAPPPGLIAPLSPRLAEEDEEEEGEGPLKNKSSCSKQPEPSAERKNVRGRRRILWAKQSKRQVKSRPGISTHIQKKTASDEERTQPDQSVKKSKVGVKKKQPEKKCRRTSIQKGRPETQTKDTQQQNEEKRRDKEGAEGRVKSVWLKTKWVERQRRSVGPPVRFLVEYEEKSHGLSTANHVKEAKEKVIEKEEQAERTESRLVEASVGVEKQPCQLPVSIHKHRRKPRLLLHHRHYQRNKGSCHATRGLPAGSQDGDGRLKEAALAEVKVKKEKEKEERLHPVPTEAPDGTTHQQSLPGKTRCQKNDDEPVSERRCKEEEEVKQVHAEKKEVKEVLQRPRRTMVGPPIRYLLESELPHRLITAHLGGEEEEEEQEDTTDQDEELTPKYRQETQGQCTTDVEAVGGASETTEAPRHVKRVLHWDKMRRHKRPKFVKGEERCSEKMEMQNTEEAIRTEKEERKHEAELERVITPPQRLRRTMVGPPIRYLLESELPHRLITANFEREEEEEQEDMTDQDEELTPECRQEGRGKCLTDMEAVGGASETTEAPRHVKRVLHWNKMKRHRRLKFVSKKRRCSKKMEVQKTEEVIGIEKEERKQEAELERVITPPQRLRRTMVGPPIRYLLESELPHRLLTANFEREEEEEQEDMTDQDEEHTPECRQEGRGKCLTDMEAVGGASETTEAPRHVKRVLHWNKMKRHRRLKFVSKERRCSKKMEVQKTEEAIRTEKEERKHEAELERVITPPQRLRRTMVGPPIRYLLESELPHCLVTANFEREEEEEQEDLTDQDEELTPEYRQEGRGKCLTDMEAVGGASETTEAPRRVRRVLHWKKVKRHRRLKFVNKDRRCSKKMEVQKTEEAIRTEKEERKHEAELERVITPPQRLRRTMVGPPIRYLLESELPHRLVTANFEREEEEEQEDMTDQDEELTPECRQEGRGKCLTDMEAVGGASETTEASRRVKRVLHWNKMRRHRRLKFVNKERRCSKIEGQKTEEAIRMKMERRRREREESTQVTPPKRVRRTMVGPPVRYLLESEEPLHVPQTASNKTIESTRKPLKITAEGGASRERDKIDRPGDTPLTSETGNERRTDLTNLDDSSRLKCQQRSPREVGTGREAGGGAFVITNKSGAAEMQTGVIAMEVVWQEGGQMEKRWREEQTKELKRIERRQKDRERRRRLKMEDQFKGVITPPPLLHRPRRTMVSPPVRYLIESEENHPVRANQNRAGRRRGEAGGGTYGDTSVIGGPGDSQGQSSWTLESPLIYIDPDSRKATVLPPCSVSLQRLL